MAKIFKIQQKRAFDIENRPDSSNNAQAPSIAASQAGPEKLSTPNTAIHNFPTPENATLGLFGMPVESVFSQQELEAYDERAGIMEHEAHLDKTEAEGLAVAEIVSTRDPIPIDLSAFDCIEIKGALYDSLPKFTQRDEDEKNGIKRLSNYPGKAVIRETVPPWDRLPRAGNAGW